MESGHAFEKRLPDYIIQKLKKTSRLYNPEINHAYKKRLMDDVIRKLITYFKKKLLNYVIRSIREVYFWK